jgi:hypothetical protein
MLHRVTCVRTDVSEEPSASFIREALCSSEMSVLTRATRRNFPEDTILYSHRRENLKSYKLNYEYNQKLFHFKIIFRFIPR